jgi:quinol monooxygenase YgiN
MSGVAINALVRARPGREAALENWMGRLIARIRSDGEGVVAFGFYRTATPGDYVCVEQYESPAAALHHLHSVGALLAELADLTEAAGAPLQVCGDLSTELRALYAPWNPVFLPPVATA